LPIALAVLGGMLVHRFDFSEYELTNQFLIEAARKIFEKYWISIKDW